MEGLIRTSALNSTEVLGVWEGLSYIYYHQLMNNVHKIASLFCNGVKNIIIFGIYDHCLFFIPDDFFIFKLPVLFWNEKFFEACFFLLFLHCKSIQSSVFLYMRLSLMIE